MLNESAKLIYYCFTKKAAYEYGSITVYNIIKWLNINIIKLNNFLKRWIMNQFFVCIQNQIMLSYHLYFHYASSYYACWKCLFMTKLHWNTLYHDDWKYSNGILQYENIDILIKFKFYSIHYCIFTWIE